MGEPPLSALVDTNVLVRHLTGDPPDQAAAATRFLGKSHNLILVDVVVAECVYVLESFYEASRERVAEALRSAIALPSITVIDRALLLRALEVYEHYGVHFAEAYLVAAAELNGIQAVASFDRDLDRVASVRRVEP